MKYEHMMGIFAAVVAVGLLGYLFLGGSESSSPTLYVVNTGEPGFSPPAGSVEYRSERYGFSLYLPKELEVHEYDEGGGAATLTFEDSESGQGFQIFVVPFAGNTVSEERFLKDVPSGVLEDPKDIALAGISATSFGSENDAMGKTREVWFIKNGFLFEVTTYRALDAWLSEIMTTWQFSKA